MVSQSPPARGAQPPSVPHPQAAVTIPNSKEISVRRSQAISSGFSTAFREYHMRFPDPLCPIRVCHSYCSFSHPDSGKLAGNLLGRAAGTWPQDIDI